MAKNTSISLGDHFAEFVEERVRSGRFGSVSEVVRAGLRLLEAEEVRLATLRAALVEGEESGPSAPFDFEAFFRISGPRDSIRISGPRDSINQ